MAAGVGSIDDLNMTSTPTWESFSKLIMAEILENIPQLERENVISQLQELKNQSYMLKYRFKPFGKGEHYIVINGTLDQAGIWERGNFASIYFSFAGLIRDYKAMNSELPWVHPSSLGKALHLFDENLTGAEFQSITVKKVNEANEGGAFTSYITCTPDGYLFRTSK